MASVIISISKKSPQEELLEMIKKLNPEFTTDSVVGPTIVDDSKFLSEVITSLPILLEGQQPDLHERFTLIVYLFSENTRFAEIVNALEEFSIPLQALYALSFIYDIVTSSHSKFLIFRAIYRQARKDSGLLTLIQPHLLKIEDFIRSWSNVPELNQTILDLLELSVPDSIKSRLIIKLLSEDINQEAVDKLIAKFISTVGDYEVEEILSLQSYKKASPVVTSLIQLLISSSTSNLISYWKEHESELKSKNFDEKRILEISRISGLVKLANSTNKITFSQAAEALSIDENEVDF
jgi:hypothetical protein